MKKIRQMNRNLNEALGTLAYIPSDVKLWKMDEQDKAVVSDSIRVCEPAVVPLIAISKNTIAAQIYYNGTLWWTNVDDLYGVER